MLKTSGAVLKRLMEKSMWMAEVQVKVPEQAA